MTNNHAASYPDVLTSTITANNSLIGVPGAANIVGANNLFGVEPMLDLLRDNGGATMTMLPLPGSPVVDMGANPGMLPFDQRGPGFPRVVGPAADIGAAEGVQHLPVGITITPPVTDGGATSQSVIVRYSALSSLDVSSLTTGDITIEGPGGFMATPTFVSLDPPGNGVTRTATYQFTPPGGSWDVPDNGDYTVRLNGNQVFDLAGTPAPAGAIGAFNVAAFVPTVYWVTNTAASGPGSFLQAVLDATANPKTDTIQFASDVTGKIVPNMVLPDLEDGLTIHGPGAHQVSLRSPAGRMFNAKSLTLTGLTIRDCTVGFSNPSMLDGGGAMRSVGTLIIRDCRFINNQAFTPNGIGGALIHGGPAIIERTLFQGNGAVGGDSALQIVGSSITLNDCTITQNFIIPDMTSRGGAMTLIGNIEMSRTFITNNATTTMGQTQAGGLNAGGGTFLATNCVISGNSARDVGGASIGGVATLRHCTIVGNSALAGTGGVLGGVVASTLILENSVIANNIDDQVANLSVSKLIATNSLVGTGANIGTYVDLGGNLPSGTPTNFMLDGSPGLNSALLNAGSNPANLPTDARGGSFRRVIGKAADIGAFENQTLPATVLGVTINDGAAQRSRIDRIAITFDRPMTLPGNPADAFRVRRVSDGLLAPFSVSQLDAVVTLSFAGPQTVPDGRYELMVLAGPLGNFDGDGNLTIGDDFTTPFHRLFGDSNGDAKVDAMDFLAFRLGFQNNAPAYDHDGNGTVSASDFLAFRLRFLAVV